METELGLKGRTGLEKIRTFIVDSCAEVRNGIQSILRAYPDIEVVGEAADGLDAIAKAEALEPSVILVDAQLPGMGGIEATRRIKERWPNIRVLFLTVHPSYIEAALGAGADDYLMKDCTRQELLQAIRSLGHGA